MEQRMKTTIEQATVAIPKLGGQGFLIPGNLILTAAHCLDWDGDGRMVLGDHYVESITTHSGEELRVCPVAIEPLTDIAVLGALDAQEFWKESSAFEEWCDRTVPVPLSTDDVPIQKAFPIHILALGRKWVSGEAELMADGPTIFVTAAGRIRGGSSGGPIVNQQGEIVAVVSLAMNSQHDDETESDEEPSVGPQPRPTFALPVYVVRQILGDRFGEVFRPATEGREDRSKKIRTGFPVHNVEALKELFDSTSRK